MLKCTNAQMLKCSNAQMLKCSTKNKCSQMLTNAQFATPLLTCAKQMLPKINKCSQTASKTAQKSAPKSVSQERNGQCLPASTPMAPAYTPMAYHIGWVKPESSSTQTQCLCKF